VTGRLGGPLLQAALIIGSGVLSVLWSIVGCRTAAQGWGVRHVRGWTASVVLYDLMINAGVWLTMGAALTSHTPAVAPGVGSVATVATAWGGRRGISFVRHRRRERIPPGARPADVLVTDHLREPFIDGVAVRRWLLTEVRNGTNNVVTHWVQHQLTPLVRRVQPALYEQEVVAPFESRMLVVRRSKTEIELDRRLLDALRKNPADQRRVATVAHRIIGYGGAQFLRDYVAARKAAELSELGNNRRGPRILVRSDRPRALRHSNR
jgi:hypothetical protein